MRIPGVFGTVTWKRVVRYARFTARKISGYLELRGKFGHRKHVGLAGPSSSWLVVHRNAAERRV